MDDLVMWLRAQLDDDERWAQEASRDRDRYTPTGEHWRWECEATDTPATVDPMLGEYVEGVDGAPVGLRSIEGYPSTWGATLYHLVIRGQDELPAAAAGHIARHDPARVLAEVDAKRRILDEYGKALDRRKRHPDDLASAGALLTIVHVVKLHALPYAEREGYRDDWRP